MAVWSVRSSLARAVTYTIKLPRDEPFRSELIYSTMQRICQNGKMLFRIVADHSAIQFQVMDMSEYASADAIKNVVLASYPQAEVTAEPYVARSFKRPCKRWVLLFHQIAPFVAPIRYPTELKGYDPLVTLTNMLSDLWPDEYVTYSVFVGETSPKA